MDWKLNGVQCGAVRSGAVQCGAVLCGAVKGEEPLVSILGGVVFW